MLHFLLCTFVSSVVAVNSQNSDPRASFPKLYHLDDRGGCAAAGAVYCYGVFDLDAAPGHALMQQIRDHSSVFLNLNRTQIFRGLCLSRCGRTSASTPQDLFAACVSTWTERRYQLQTTPLKIYYCERDIETLPLDYGAWAFLAVTFAIVGVTLAALLYELYWYDGNDAGWRKFLLAWSLRRNWRRIFVITSHKMAAEPYKMAGSCKMAVAPGKARDPASLNFHAVHNIKSLLTVFVVAMHVVTLRFTGNVGDGIQFEDIIKTRLAAVLFQGYPLVQMYLMVSVLQVTHQLLLMRTKFKFTPLSLGMVSLRRLSRVVPLYWYMLFWGATWWPRLDPGPLGPRVAAEEQSACRTHFWTHALHLNNVVEPVHQCMMPSWYVALDLQMFVVTMVLLQIMLRLRRPIRCLSVLLVGSIVFNFFIAYNTDAKSVLDVFNHHYAKPSQVYLYLPPWGALPTVIMALMLAFCLHQPKTSEALAKSTLVHLLVYLAPVALLAWIGLGSELRMLKDPLAVALVSTLDRPLVVLLGTVAAYGLLHDYQDLISLIARWRGWILISRTSLACLLVNWPIIMYRVANDVTLADGTFWSFILESSVVWALTLLVAGLVTVLLQLPARTFLEICLDAAGDKIRKEKKPTTESKYEEEIRSKKD